MSHCAAFLIRYLICGSGEVDNVQVPSYRGQDPGMRHGRGGYSPASTEGRVAAALYTLVQAELPGVDIC